MNHIEYIMIVICKIRTMTISHSQCYYYISLSLCFSLLLVAWPVLFFDCCGWLFYMFYFCQDTCHCLVYVQFTVLFWLPSTMMAYYVHLAPNISLISVRCYSCFYYLYYEAAMVCALDNLLLSWISFSNNWVLIWSKLVETHCYRKTFDGDWVVSIFFDGRTDHHLLFMTPWFSSQSHRVSCSQWARLGPDKSPVVVCRTEPIVVCKLRSLPPSPMGGWDGGVTLVQGLGWFRGGEPFYFGKAADLTLTYFVTGWKLTPLIFCWNWSFEPAWFGIGWSLLKIFQKISGAGVNDLFIYGTEGCAAFGGPSSARCNEYWVL